MPPLSKIRKLPVELREQINAMLAAGHSVKHIAEVLRAMGADVSAAGVGRHRLQWAEAMKDLEEVRQFAEAAVRDMANEPESKVSRLNIQLLEGALYSALTALRMRDMEPEDAVKLLVRASMAQQLISRANKDEAETIIKASGFADAKQGDLLVKEGDKLVRVEFVEAHPVKALPEAASKPDAKKKKKTVE